MNKNNISDGHKGEHLIYLELLSIHFVQWNLHFKGKSLFIVARKKT